MIVDYSKKTVIVRRHDNGIVEFIPAQVKALICEEDVKKAHDRFKKDQAEANQILKNE